MSKGAFSVPDTALIVTSIVLDTASVCAIFAIPEYTASVAVTCVAAGPVVVATATLSGDAVSKGAFSCSDGAFITTSVAWDTAIAEMCVGAAFTILDAASLAAPALCCSCCPCCSGNSKGHSGGIVVPRRSNNSQWCLCKE